MSTCLPKEPPLIEAAGEDDRGLGEGHEEVTDRKVDNEHVGRRPEASAPVRVETVRRCFCWKASPHCGCTHTHVHMYTHHMHTHIHAHARMRTHTCTCACTRTRTCTHPCTGTHACTHAHVHARTHAHACARAHAHTSMNTHAHVLSYRHEQLGHPTAQRVPAKQLWCPGKQAGK